MKNDQAAEPRLEASPTEYLSLEIEELEAIIAPGNTWSV